MVRFAITIPLLPAFLLTAVGRADAAEDRALRVTKADCARLVSYRPAPDVAYRPGVDVRNRPVVPADLADQPLRLPDIIVIPITVELQERFGIPADSALFEAEAEVGRVAVEGNRITFNGQPLGDPEILALVAACRRAAPDRR